MDSSGGKGPGLVKHPPGSPLSKETLERVTRRDPEALGILFDAYFKRIYNVAYRLMGDKAAAEDVAQDVFLKVHRAAHQLDPERDPGPWLMTITTNVCRERWRSRVGRQDKRTDSLDAQSDIRPEPAVHKGTPEADAVRMDRSRHLHRALQELPEEARVVVVLHDLNGISHNEIGTIMGLEPATVRKRYSRALKKLRELLPEGLV